MVLNKKKKIYQVACPYFSSKDINWILKTTKKVTVEVKSPIYSKPVLEAKIKKQVTLTEKQHIINLFKLLVKEDINVDNISFKRNELNNIVATYLQETTVKNTGKVIDGVLKVLEKKKQKWL